MKDINLTISPHNKLLFRVLGTVTFALMLVFLYKLSYSVHISVGDMFKYVCALLLVTLFFWSPEYVEKVNDDY